MDFKVLASLSNEKLEAYKVQFKEQPSVVASIQGILDTRKALEAEADKSIGAELQAEADKATYLEKCIKGMKNMPKDAPISVLNVLYRRVAKPVKDKDGNDTPVEELVWSCEINHVCKTDKNSPSTSNSTTTKGKLAVHIYEQISQPMQEADGKPKKDTNGNPVMQVIEKDLNEWPSIRAFCTNIGIPNKGASARQDLANNTLGRHFRVVNLS